MELRDQRHRRQSGEGSSERARAANEFQWSDWRERRGRRVGLTTWEECLTVERAGASEMQLKSKHQRLRVPADDEVASRSLRGIHLSTLNSQS